jgi:hypothetical protein
VFVQTPGDREPRVGFLPAGQHRAKFSIPAE